MASRLFGKAGINLRIGHIRGHFPAAPLTGGVPFRTFRSMDLKEFMEKLGVDDSYVGAATGIDRSAPLTGQV